MLLTREADGLARQVVVAVGVADEVEVLDPPHGGGGEGGGVVVEEGGHHTVDVVVHVGVEGRIVPGEEEEEEEELI